MTVFVDDLPESVLRYLQDGNVVDYKVAGRPVELPDVPQHFRDEIGQLFSAYGNKPAVSHVTEDHYMISWGNVNVVRLRTTEV